MRKGQRRFEGFDDKIVAMYARGMTTRDIEAHLKEIYGASVGRDTVSQVTNAVLADAKAWQTRPLECVYPIVYLDALVVKIRDGQAVRIHHCYLAIGVNTDGQRDLLGLSGPCVQTHKRDEPAIWPQNFWRELWPSSIRSREPEIWPLRRARPTPRQPTPTTITPVPAPIVRPPFLPARCRSPADPPPTLAARYLPRPLTTRTQSAVGGWSATTSEARRETWTGRPPPISRRDGGARTPRMSRAASHGPEPQ